MMGPDFAFVTRVGLSGESLVVIGRGYPGNYFVKK
jgi:hypothetical protein